MGNLWYVWKPPHGWKNKGRNDEVVVEKYRNDFEGLAKEANRLRSIRRRSESSTRAEGVAPDASLTREQIEQDLRDVAAKLNLDPKAIIVYKREGSTIYGFTIEPFQIIELLAASIVFIDAALRLYPWMKASLALRQIQEERLDTAVEEDLHDRLIGFHLSHLRRKEARILDAILSKNHIGPIRSSRKLSKYFDGIPPASLKRSIQKILGVQVTFECSPCLILLAAAAQRVDLMGAGFGV
jgi:hypothetical protein